MPAILLTTVAQEVIITALHAVVHAFEHGGDDVPAAVAVGTGERVQVLVRRISPP